MVCPRAPEPVPEHRYPAQRVAALVIWLVYKDRSQKVAFHALQSMWYQVAWLVLLGAGWAFTGLLMLVLTGFLLVPVMVLLTLVPFVHAAYAAYRVSGFGSELVRVSRRLRDDHDRQRS